MDDAPCVPGSRARTPPTGQTQRSCSITNRQAGPRSVLVGPALAFTAVGRLKRLLPSLPTFCRKYDTHHVQNRCHARTAGSYCCCCRILELLQIHSQAAPVSLLCALSATLVEVLVPKRLCVCWRWESPTGQFQQWGEKCYTHV